MFLLSAIEGWIKILEQLYIRQTTEQEIFNGGSLLRLLRTHEDQALLDFLEVCQSKPIYSSELKNIPDEDVLTVDFIELKIKKNVEYLQECYKKRVMEHPAFKQYQKKVSSSGFFSDRALSIKTMQRLCNIIYKEEIAFLASRKPAILDFLFQTFFSTTNLKQICSSSNISPDTTPFFCRLFITFMHLYNFKYMSISCIDLANEFLSAICNVVWDFIEKYPDFFSKSNHCWALIRKGLPMKLFSEHVLNEVLNNDHCISVMIFPKTFLPIFQIPNGDFQSFLKTNSNDYNLSSLRSFIFMKKEGVHWLFEIPVIFFAFGRRFLLSAFHVFSGEISVLRSAVTLRTGAIENWNLNDRAKRHYPSVSTLNRLIQSSHHKTVFLYYDHEIQ